MNFIVDLYCNYKIHYKAQGVSVWGVTATASCLFGSAPADAGLVDIARESNIQHLPATGEGQGAG